MNTNRMNTNNMNTNNKLHKLHAAGQTYFVELAEKSGWPGFYDAACFKYYELRLLNFLRAFGVKLHAYVLLKSTIYLLLTPGSPTAVNNLLGTVNRAYEEYFNRRFSRKTKVWARYQKSRALEDHKLVLDCQKYIESAPLRNKLATHAGTYPWSSYCDSAFGVDSKYLTQHSALNAFLRSNSKPHESYREFIATPFENVTIHTLEHRIRQRASQDRGEDKPQAITLLIPDTGP